MNTLVKSEKSCQEDIYMLILTRHIGEQIVAGEHGEIKFKLLEIDGGQIRVSITAPGAIPVYRKEIYDRIQKEKTRAQ